METFGLVVKKARNGKGIYTQRVYKAGERVFELEGKVISIPQMDRSPKKFRDNTYRIGKLKYLSPKGCLGDFLNHSCSPNVYLKVFRGKYYITAIKEILKNKEILLDYSTILATDDGWDMKCNCGSKNCRELIEMYCYLPARVLDTYKRQKLIPKYILEIE